MFQLTARFRRQLPVVKYDWHQNVRHRDYLELFISVRFSLGFGIKVHLQTYLCKKFRQTATCTAPPSTNGSCCCTSSFASVPSSYTFAHPVLYLT